MAQVPVLDVAPSTNWYVSILRSDDDGDGDT